MPVHFWISRVIKFPWKQLLLRSSEMEYFFSDTLLQTKQSVSCCIDNEQRDWFESVLCTNVCCAEQIWSTWFNCKLSTSFCWYPENSSLTIRIHDRLSKKRCVFVKYYISTPLPFLLPQNVSTHNVFPLVMFAECIHVLMLQEMNTMQVCKLH